MNYETVILEKKDHVARVTLNRPERLNALNRQMFRELNSALDDVAADSDIWAVVLTGAGRAFSFAGADESRGHARKTTGSFYTPDELVQVLLDSALAPVVDHTVDAHPERPADALLDLAVVDPACGSGHFLLAAARRLADRVARIRAGGTPAPDDYQRALRDVVRRCLYGVDRKWAGRMFTPFWDALSALGVPLFFTLYATDYDDYLEELRTLRRWMERYPDVTVVQTHGFNWRMFADDEKLVVPDEVYEAAPIEHPNYHIQLLFAVFLQRRWDYPMPQILPTMERMYRRIGPEKLIWGTDIPVSLLWWTYRQNLDFLRSYCDFIPQSDMDLIFGGNMARIMGVETSSGKGD